MWTNIVVIWEYMRIKNLPMAPFFHSHKRVRRKQCGAHQENPHSSIFIVREMLRFSWYPFVLANFSSNNYYGSHSLLRFKWFAFLHPFVSPLRFKNATTVASFHLMGYWCTHEMSGMGFTGDWSGTWRVSSPYVYITDKPRGCWYTHMFISVKLFIDQTTVTDRTMYIHKTGIWPMVYILRTLSSTMVCTVQITVVET